MNFGATSTKQIFNIMTLTIIACVDNLNLLGLKDGRLAYRFKEDLQFFAEYTASKKIITSRKTFETIPNRLPGRDVFAFSNTRPAIRKTLEGKYWHFWQSLRTVLVQAQLSDEEYVVIGGAEIYSQAMPHCNKAIITRPTPFGLMRRQFNHVPPGQAVRFDEKAFRKQFNNASKILKDTELFTTHKFLA